MKFCDTNIHRPFSKAKRSKSCQEIQANRARKPDPKDRKRLGGEESLKSQVTKVETRRNQS